MMVKSLKKRAYTKLGFSGLETVEIVTALNTLLANYHIHYQKMRNFHWNVKGNNFFELHRQFSDLYEQAKNNIDAIAERIRVFGKTPLSNYSQYLEISTIEEADPEINSTMMVRVAMDDFQTLLSLMNDVAEAADHIGDVGSEDMITEFVKDMEKSHWMFNAWLRRERNEK